jgi:hypothetical protein
MKEGLIVKVYKIMVDTKQGRFWIRSAGAPAPGIIVKDLTFDT